MNGMATVIPLQFYPLHFSSGFDTDTRSCDFKSLDHSSLRREVGHRQQEAANP